MPTLDPFLSYFILIGVVVVLLVHVLIYVKVMRFFQTHHTHKNPVMKKKGKSS